jgi:hypothetical protein
MVVSGGNGDVFVRGIGSVRMSFRRAVLDCGAVQSDALSLDMKGAIHVILHTPCAQMS